MSNFLLGMLVMWFIYPMVKMSRKIVATKFHAYMATETGDVVVDETTPMGFKLGIGDN